MTGDTLRHKETKRRKSDARVIRLINITVIRVITDSSGSLKQSQKESLKEISYIYRHKYSELYILAEMFKI